MLAVSRAKLGPHASKILSANGRSFWGGGHTAGMVQTLWDNGLDRFNHGAHTVSDTVESAVVGLHGFAWQ